jgi:ElaB/YqjD/DUF883 family membrane-anchored ribosome-binding protein
MGATYDREHFAQEHTAPASSDSTRAGVTAPTDARGNAAEMAANLAQQCRGVVENVTRYTRTQPLSALAMAAGLGLLIGRRLTAARTGRRDLSGASGVHWPPRMESTS